MKKNKQKTIILSGLLLVVLGICLFVFGFTAKKATIELGDENIESINNYLGGVALFKSLYKLDVSNVDFKKIGTYNYSISKFGITKNSTIDIIDTTAPLILVKKATITSADDLDLNDLIVECEDYSLPCKYTISSDFDEESLNISGEYTLPLVIFDAVGNKTKSFVPITVVNDKGESTIQKDANYLLREALVKGQK